MCHINEAITMVTNCDRIPQTKCASVQAFILCKCIAFLNKRRNSCENEVLKLSITTTFVFVSRRGDI